MRRIVRIQQRKRQTWLALPASGIEEVGHVCNSTAVICKERGETQGAWRGRASAPGAGWREADARRPHGVD